MTNFEGSTAPGDGAGPIGIGVPSFRGIGVADEVGEAETVAVEFLSPERLQAAARTRMSTTPKATPTNRIACFCKVNDFSRYMTTSAFGPRGTSRYSTSVAPGAIH